MKIFIILLFMTSTVFATTLETLFEDHFYTLHVPGKCGQNILKFLELAKKENLDLTGAEIINVNQGWVEPLYVRNLGYSPKQPGPAGMVHPPGKRYFYFHVFLVHDNKVYDFDYGNTPVVPDFGTYFKKMWISGKPGDDFLGLSLYPAEEYLQGKNFPTNRPSQNLLKYFHSKSKKR